MEGMFAWRTKAAACARVPSAVPQLPNLQDRVSQMWQRHSSKKTSLPLTKRAILYNIPFNWLERTARAADTRHIKASRGLPVQARSPAPAMPPPHSGLPTARTHTNQPEPAARLCTLTSHHIYCRWNSGRRAGRWKPQASFPAVPWAPSECQVLFLPSVKQQ